MDVEFALVIANDLVFGKTVQHLTTLQTKVFRGAWLDQTYDDMATTYHCSEAHLKKVGATLWELLSNALGEEVKKKRFELLWNVFSKKIEHC